MSRQKLGQHFLHDPGILARIAAAACAVDEPLTIEIGPGQGALTAHLMERARRVVAIEIDPELVRHLRRRFADRPGLEIVAGDAREIDLTQWGPAVLAGNLPYYAATPILERAAGLGPAIPRSVFLIQKEVAERVTARPGTRDYGYFTVLLELDVASEILFQVKPGAFRPSPKVDSAVVRLTHRPRARELGIEEVDEFRRFLSACFRQKRKTLRNNLTKLNLVESIEPIPELSRRAEQLTLEEFAELFRRLYHSAWRTTQ